MATKSISISDELASRVEELAETEVRKFSNMVEVLLDEALRHREENDKEN